MARIAGINIPLNKRVEIGLTYIYGIGPSLSRDILERSGVGRDTYVRDLTDDEVLRIRNIVDNDLTVEGDLRRERSQDIKRLMEIGCYRGLRHRRGLPVRGQRTKTNARSRKGPKRMAAAGKKKVRKERTEWHSSAQLAAAAVAVCERTSPWVSRTSSRASTTRLSRSPTAR